MIGMARRVMVVDDEEGFREVYSSVLRGNGFDVVTAANGIECLEKLRKSRVDVVLMDVLMPMMSGLDVIKRIRGDDSLKDIRIFVLTVMNLDDKTLEHLRVLGVDSILLKPVEAGVLVRMIRGVVG